VPGCAGVCRETSFFKQVEGRSADVHFRRAVIT
jgi:hypothetical protein